MTAVCPDCLKAHASPKCVVRLHKHMVGHRLVVTRGEGYDCPPERACWFDVSTEREAEDWIRLYAHPTDLWH